MTIFVSGGTTDKLLKQFSNNGTYRNANQKEPPKVFYEKRCS